VGQQASRRRRHRRRPDSGATEGSSSQEVQSWQWRTFPVAFAFAAGIFVMSWLAFVPGLNIMLFIVSLVAVALGLAHILARQVIGRRRG
jgi:hypothetical protein